MLDAAEIAAQLETARRTLFRLEGRRAYDVPGDREEFARFRSGAPAPSPERKQPWLEYLVAERAAGRVRERVRVLRQPLSDYERFECAWSYEPNTKAGEVIGILDLSEPREGALAPIIDQDFWLLDDQRVVLMEYDVLDRLVGGWEITDADVVRRYRATRDAAWRAAESFTAFWARHGKAALSGPAA